MKNKILDLILRVAAEQNSMLPQPIDVAKGAEAGLYGPDGVLDSMALVQFVIEIEAQLQETFGLAVTLASDRAMSQRRSPFLTTGSLAAYAQELLKEAGLPTT
jgi:hypothetical protein